MANEIQVNVSITCAKNGVSVGNNTTLIADLAGNNFAQQILATSTSAAAIPVGGLSTYGGWFMLKNMSSTTGEDIIIYQDGATATVEIGRIKPGESWVLKPAAALGCKSATGTPDLSVIAIEP